MVKRRKRKPSPAMDLTNDKFLRKLGYRPSSSYSVGPMNFPKPFVDDRPIAPTSDRIPEGVGAKRANTSYSGDNLLGIATMHKSNMVPVFKDNKQVAEDIAKMRR